ncbi:MAG: cyclic nucleotide-binding domain-containing protein [Candidatus Cloacimonetes bacterium]|nr:cyclic nucleotide-binding domain-containing protein [Candidatus Cloacimonadota bacterium]
MSELSTLHKTVGIIANDEDFVNKLKQIFATLDNQSFNATYCDNYQTASEFLDYELPNILIIDISSPIENLEQLQKSLKDDHWLVNTGVILAAQSNERASYIEKARDWNLLSIIDKSKSKDFQRVLDFVLRKWDLLKDSSTFSQFEQNPNGTIIIKNDMEEAERTANMIASFLFETGRIDRKKFYSVSMGLSELLINAVEHGNCGLTFDCKTQLLEDDVNMVDYVRELAQSNPEIGRKRVQLDYEILHDCSIWKISDEGEGFDHSDFVEPDPERLLLSHGRGIIMARTCSDKLVYNPKGNVATLTCYHSSEEQINTPVGFRDEEHVKIDVGGKVFDEGEFSSHLFYILSGEFDVFSNNKKLGSLKPSDLFVGEMSFLLNQKRTATVIATSPATLIKLSKQSFIKVVKKYPNYLILVSRLLAQRLSRSNSDTVYKM